MAQKNITENVTTLANFHSNSGTYRDSFLSDQNKEMVFKNTNSYMWTPNRYYNGTSFTYLSSTWLNLTANGTISTVDLSASGDITGVDAAFTGDLYSDKWAFYNDQDTGFVSTAADQFDINVGGSLVARLREDVGELYTNIYGYIGLNKDAEDTHFEIYNNTPTIDLYSQILSTANYSNPFTSFFINESTCFASLIKDSDYGGVKLFGISGTPSRCGDDSALDLVGMIGQSGALSGPIITITGMKKDSLSENEVSIEGDEIITQVKNNTTATTDFKGDGEIVTYRSGMYGLVNRTLWIKSSNTTIANTSAETSLGGNIVTFTDSFFKLSKAFRLRLAGFFSTKSTGAGNLTIKIKLGSTIIAQSSAFTLDTNISNGFWELGECCFAIRSIGVSGTIFGQCGFKHSFADVAQDELHIAPMVNTTATTIDTTASHVLTVTAQFSVADATNTITCTCGHVDEVY
jgi:hypothetical protein